MNVWDHLGELRRRLLICLSVLALGVCAGFWTVDPVLEWLVRPVGELVFVQPTGAFTAQLKIAVWISFLLALPVLLFQAWAFVSSGLTAKEIKSLRWLVPVSYVFFLAGFAFSTFVIFPKGISFLLSLGSRHLKPMISVEAYLDMFSLSGLVLGFLFQLPLALYFLVRAGIVQAASLAKSRKLTYLVIFILASLLNPGPDVFTQVSLAAAAILLFEFSIILVRWKSPR